jgi:hypothetical protein
MGALRPVGVNTTFATSTSSTQTTAIPQQSDTLRVVALDAGVHIAYGNNPTATSSNFFVSTTDTAEISLGPVASQRVVAYTKGTTTTLDFPEGTGCPFGPGEAVSLTVSGQAAFDFTHQTVLSVDNTSGRDGFFGTRCVIDYNSSSVVGTFDSNYATLRRSIKIAAVTASGTGTVHIQQVQTS